ncbi:MAG: cysteine desulfurase [Bacillales bacterium]|jgi:cysteine desulfurase/selenocysteine lyase|nr:cysteine desulfurase [Bacillales bacterium]
MSFNVKKIRKDFPLLNAKHTLAYFDNSATTFKPLQVVKAVDDYYLNFPSNIHRGEYDLSHNADERYEEARNIVADFINAKKEEIAFTSGTTESLNFIAYGLGKVFLKEGDEIIISTSEHASNILPWYRLQEDLKIKVKLVPLDSKGRITLKNVIKTITEKTKVISLAHVSNVLGYILPLKEIVEYAHKFNIIVVADAAQSVPHMKVDVKDLDVDFLAFSGHKMLGPTGIGVMYGKKELMNKIPPLLLGGGMNTRFDKEGNYTFKESPEKFEAGTPPIAQAIGLGEAIKYIQKIGFAEIQQHIGTLRKKLIKNLTKIEGLKIYNPNAESGIVTINYKNVFAQDIATFFNVKGVAVRSGQHCAKILNDFLMAPGTVRISIYIYNTKEEIEQLIKACQEGDNYLDAYFR